jgi:hypothetical protein
MTRFIKLKNLVINTTKITKIQTYENKYYLYMSGNNLKGWLIYGSGMISTDNDIIEICKTKIQMIIKL